MTPITDLILPALFVAGCYLAAAVGLRRAGQVAYARLTNALWMGKDAMPRSWRPRHALYSGRPALVAAMAMSVHAALTGNGDMPDGRGVNIEPAASLPDLPLPSPAAPANTGAGHDGATEDWSPAAEVAEVGPGRLRQRGHDGTLDGWLADDRTEADFAEEERDWTAEFDKVTESMSFGPAAAAACTVRIGEHLAAFLRTAEAEHGQPITITAESLRRHLDEKARLAAEELGKRILAAEPPTGEYPIVVARPRRRKAAAR